MTISRSPDVPAGYSDTPLVKKLGIKPGMRLRFVDAPAHYEDLLGKLPEEVMLARATRGSFDFIHLFVMKRSRLEQQLGSLKGKLDKAGMIWVSWPKKSSPLAGEVDEGLVRQTGLAAGLVDVKICAVDEDWSGLKFVYRFKDR